MKWLAFTIAFLWFGTAGAAADSQYSGWFGTNNTDVRYQWRSETYGKGIPSDCPMRFQYSGPAERFKGHVIVQYVPSGTHANPGEGKFDIDILRGVPKGGYAALNCNYINSVKVTSGNTIATASKRFNRPTITGVELDRGSIDLLKSESEKLKLAGAAKGLLAWSPLIALAGEREPLHIVLSVYENSWTELGEAIGKADKLAFISLAISARNYANTERELGKAKLYQFWSAMADFYYFEAQQP
jgi:hypothetical protein